MSASYCKDYRVAMADGAAVSEALNIAGATRGSFAVGATFENNVDIEVSNDGSNWAALDTAAGITYDAFDPTDNAPYIIPAEAFHFRWLRFTASGNQTDDNTITVTLMGS